MFNLILIYFDYFKNYFQIIVNDLEILKFVEIEEDNNKNKNKKYKTIKNR